MRRIDDSIHPSLGTARPISQAHFTDDSFRRPRAQQGHAQIMQRPIQHALTPFMGMGGPVAGRPIWSVNPYVGCAHACSYCYVPDTLHAERGRWGRYVVVKQDFVRQLRRDLRTRPQGPIYLSTGTDPYQPIEAEHAITRACIAEIAKAGWPLDVLTRGPLVTRDIDVLRAADAASDGRLRVGLTIPTLDDKQRALVEPLAPTVAARLDALRRLSDAGLRTYANIAPTYPPSARNAPEALAIALAEAGARWANLSAWRYRRSIAPVIVARLGPDDPIARRCFDDVGMRRYRRALRHALQREGVPARTGFFNPPFALPTDATTGSLHDPADADAAAPWWRQRP